MIRIFMNNYRRVFFSCVVLVLCSFNPQAAQQSLTRAIDFDGDGKADFVVYRPSDHNWYISKSSGGAAVLRIEQNYNVTDYFTPGDYDGDGKADLCIWRSSDATFYCLMSASGALYTKQLGQSGDEPVSRDYDGDGKTDFAVAHSQNGGLYWNILQTTNNAMLSTSFGFSSDSPVPGDYDGDGKFDLAVIRQTNNNGITTFHILKSSSGYTTLNWGTEFDLAVPGDYDDDGKTDVAIVRDTPSGFTWYILKSSNGAALVQTLGSNSLGDYPVQNDYDGDGKTDIAVWRPSTGVFYIQNSNNGNVSGFAWGTSNDYPLANTDVH